MRSLLKNWICKFTEFRGKVVWDTTKTDGQPRRCVDTSRAQREFGFKVKTRFKEGLRRRIEWFREHRRKWDNEETFSFREAISFYSDSILQSKQIY